MIPTVNSVINTALILGAACVTFLVIRRMRAIGWDGLKTFVKINRELLHSYKKVPCSKKKQQGIWSCGTARLAPTTPLYHLTRAVHKAIAELTGGRMMVVEGGGPGLMEAAAEGARSGGGRALSFAVKLEHEAAAHKFGSQTAMHAYMFLRKVRMFGLALVVAAWPGGLGTLDELFEALVLVQTKKCKSREIFLVGLPFWRGMIVWLKEVMLERGFITRHSDDPLKPKKSDFSLFTIVDLGVRRCDQQLNMGEDQLAQENPVKVIGLLDMIEKIVAGILNRDGIEFDPAELKFQVNACGNKLFEGDCLRPEFLALEDVEPTLPSEAVAGRVSVSA